MAATMIESFFQRSLEDMVKGLRTQMIGEAKYLSKALDEVKKEIKSTDPNTKAVALQKLTYLHMLQGADMSWAAFHVVEVMSMAKFSHKKIGYLAASQSFNEGTDVLLLITNLLRKDFSGKNEYETGLAIEALSRIATPDLARELTPDLFILLASGRPFVRKKATVALLRVFNEYPDAIRVAFKRLVEKMGDTDPSVVSAAVSVLCELSLKDPKPYLPLAPEFFKLLVGSPSNWLSIKLVKIFGALAPLEPRLGRKIAEPLCELMRKTGTKTGARSLLLECIQTVTLGLSEHQVAVKLCVEKLNELMREEDRNLKYLGLRALANLMPVHPWAVAENKDVITKCLSHEDPSIQKGALRLIMGMVSDDNVIETVQVLLQYAHSTDSAFCNELVSVILATCSKDQYDLISDFSWYVSVLAEMARVPQCAHGEEIGRQLIDIGFRVKSVTTDVLKAGRELVVDPALLGRPSLHGVLSAAAWIVGEYVAFSHNQFELIEGLLQPRTKLLPASVRAVYVQAVFKVFVYSAAKYALDVATGRMTEGDEHLGELSKNQSTGQGEVLNDLGFSPRVSLDHPQDHHFDSGGRISDPEAGQSSRIILDSVEAKDCSGELRPGVNGLLEAMVELVSENVTPLVTSVDVEVQERACNLMGLLQVFREIPGFPLSERRGSAQVWEIKEMLDALQAVFEVELGPVSIHAQGRVTVPEDLTVENLDGLGSLHTEEVLEGSSEREGYRQWEEGTLFAPHSKGVDKTQVGESAALLAQHRQRHENFYLLSDEKPVLSSVDYPPPRIASIDSIGLPSISSAEFFPVAEHSLASAKPRRSKARPVVVKLDDEEEQVESFSKLKLRDLKDDFISSAIRDVLAGEPRSGSKYHTPAQDFERKDSVRVRHQRSRTSRTSRHSERETNRDQASLGTRNESGVERASNQSSENEWKPSTSGKKSEHGKSSSKVRHSKHGRKARSSNEDEDDHPLARRSPVKPRVKSKNRRSGRHRATSPSRKVNNALPVPDFLL